VICCFCFLSPAIKAGFLLEKTMENERNSEIAMAYSRTVRPWTSLGLEPPSISVIEVARRAGISNPATVAGEVARGEIIFSSNGNFGSRLILEDIKGNQVENLEEAAIKAAPYKRAVKEADYRSRAPGGGPVVKRRVNERSLKRKLTQLGKGRLRVNIEAYDEDAERQRERDETKQRLELRWAGRSPIDRSPIIMQTEATLSLIRRISEKRGITDEIELTERIKTNIELGQPQTVLAIWGPPYEKQGYEDVFGVESPEERMATGIISAVNQLQETTEIKLVILYADYYGTDINGLSIGEVENYGQQIKARFEDVGKFISLSQLKDSNVARYNTVRNSLPAVVVEPDEEEVRKATIMQYKLGFTATREQGVKLARAYRTERIIEGTILQEGFLWEGCSYSNIIKLGTAPSRTNDEPYEAQLSRFYVSGMPRAAWNMPR